MTLQKVLVYGAGKSGISATKLLIKKGAYVYLYDVKSNLNVNKLKQKIGSDTGFEYITGELEDELILSFDLMVIAPGVSLDLPMVMRIRELQIPIWSEIELAYHFAKGKLIGITGTNGKTTTTRMVYEIIKTVNDETYMVGNIGYPFTEVVDLLTEASITVIELSSFQLETIDEFHPDVSAILNIAPDHLDRHHTMERYIECKENITKNQTNLDACILNYEDETLCNIAKKLALKVSFFSSKQSIQNGMFLMGEDIIYANEDVQTFFCNINELKLLGIHNYENVMAAALIGIAMKVPLRKIVNAVTNFRAVEHRIEYVDTINGVTYYNDSKATNPDAAIQAVKAMRTPTIIIAGGYDKGADFTEWIKSFGTKIRYLVLMGQTREKIAKAAKQEGFVHIILVKTLKAAVEISSKKAFAGDSVLLSPACASWDMFVNYEERGRLFKQYVKELLE